MPRCEEGSKSIMTDSSPSADVSSSSSCTRGDKTAEEGAELTALLSLCSSPSASHPQRSRHFCTLILGSMELTSVAMSDNF